MSLDRDVTARLIVEPDPQMEQKVGAATGKVNDALLKLSRNDAFDQLAKDAANMSSNTEDGAVAVKFLSREMAKVGATSKEIEQTTAKFSSNLKGAGGGGGVGGSAAAGGATAASKLGVAGAAAGQAAGLAGVSGQAGSAIGLLGSSIGALGPAGALAAGAAIGLGVALGALTDAQAKQREEVTRQNAAFADQIDLSRMTTDELLALQETRQQELDDLTARAHEAQRLHGIEVGLEAQGSLLADNFFEVGDALGIVGAAGDQASQEWKDMAKDTRTATDELKNVNDALGSVEVAANDAAKALEEQAEAQSDAALSEADSAGKRLKITIEARKLDAEGSAKRKKQIQENMAVVEEQIRVLQSSGITSEEVTKKIASLNSELELLGFEAVLTGKRAKETQKTEEDTGKKRSSMVRMFGSKMVKAEKDTGNERLKAMIDFANSIKDIEYEAAKDREQIAIDANRDQKALLRRFSHEMSMDFEQDFLGAFKAAGQLAFDVRETQIAAGQGFADVDRGAAQAQQELRASTPGAQQLINNNQTVNFNNANSTLVNAQVQSLLGV